MRTPIQKTLCSALRGLCLVFLYKAKIKAYTDHRLQESLVFAEKWLHQWRMSLELHPLSASVSRFSRILHIFTINDPRMRLVMAKLMIAMTGYTKHFLYAIGIFQRCCNPNMPHIGDALEMWNKIVASYRATVWTITSQESQGSILQSEFGARQSHQRFGCIPRCLEF